MARHFMVWNGGDFLEFLSFLNLSFWHLDSLGRKGNWTNSTNVLPLGALSPCVVWGWVAVRGSRPLPHQSAGQQGQTLYSSYLCVNRDTLLFIYLFIFKTKVQLWNRFYQSQLWQSWKDFISIDFFPTRQIYQVGVFSDGSWVSKSVGRSQPSDNLCCVSHISGKGEIISQEEFISGCGKSGGRSHQVVRPNPRVLQPRRGGGLGASGLAQEASAFAFTGLQRGDLFLWFILFCRFVEKSQVNVPCYAILCWWKESAHDVIWNGKAITRQWQKMPVIFSWSYFRIIYCQLQYFARSKYFVEYI